MAEFAYRALPHEGTVALDVDPPMTVTIDLLWLPTAPGNIRSATSYLATLAETR
jgi:hypothetical protein